MAETISKVARDMALDINTGYSSAFKTFVDFAEKTHADGHDSAAVKTPNARKAVSALLNQKFFADVDSLLYKMPSSMVDIGRDETVNVYAIPPFHIRPRFQLFSRR